MGQEGQPPTPNCSNPRRWAWGWQAQGRHRHEGEPTRAWVALPRDRAGRDDQAQPAARCAQWPGSFPLAHRHSELDLTCPGEGSLCTPSEPRALGFAVTVAALVIPGMEVRSLHVT